MCLVQRKIRQGKWKKQNEEKKADKKQKEANMEIATLNKPKTVVSVG